MAMVLLILIGSILGGSPLRAWDYDGHRLIALLALRSLPTNYPAFALTPAARERVAFLSGEPDRWRNSTDASFGHAHKPDHFFDVDELPLYGLSVSNLSSFRYMAEAQFVAGRSAHPERFIAVDPVRDPDFTRGRIGFLPWAITEQQGRLKSGFSSLRAFEEAGTVEEQSNAAQNVVYTMGVMAHFVGDAVQPLHTTRHYNGWTGANPAGYTTNRTFHAWIDGGFPSRLVLTEGGLTEGGLAGRLRPARRIAFEEFGGGRTNLFPVAMHFLQRSHEKVEPLYRLERNGGLSGSGAPSAEARALFEQQLIEGAQMLGDFWLTAWQDATPDFFLKAQLAKRKLGAAR